MTCQGCSGTAQFGVIYNGTTRALCYACQDTVRKAATKPLEVHMLPPEPAMDAGSGSKAWVWAAVSAAAAASGSALWNWLS